MFIKLKDLTFDTERLIAFGPGVLPASHVSDTMYVLMIWLSRVNEPITITYGTVEARDEDIALIEAALPLVQGS